MLIIGLAGRKRAGKDTFAGALQMQFPAHDQPLRLSFAAPIREFVAGLLGTDLEGLEKIKEEPSEFGSTPRYMMQTLGTEWGRQMIHPDIWVESLRKKIRKAKADGISCVIITDVRFENEAVMIQQEGGIVVEVIRPSLPPPDDEHVSEKPLPMQKTGASVINSGSIRDLAEPASEIIRLFGPRLRNQVGASP